MSKTHGAGDAPATPSSPDVAKEMTLQDWALNNVYFDVDLSKSGVSKPGADKDPRTSAEVTKILGDFKLHPGDEATKALLKDLKSQSDVSREAAVVSVANTLAENQGLSHRLADSSGKITREAIENLTRADHGSLIHARGQQGGAPLLTKGERDDLAFVARHTDTIDKGLYIAALASAKNAEISKTIDSHPAAKAGELAKLVGQTVLDKNKEAAEKPVQVDSRREDEPVVTTEQFVAAAKRVLAKLDTEHTGHITKEQLAKAMQDPSIKGAEAQALVAMYQNFDKLHNYAGHEGFFSDHSITSGDLEKFGKDAQANALKAGELANCYLWAKSNIKRFTKDGGDNIDEGEIDKALKDPKLSDQDRDNLKVLKKYYGEMDSMFNFSGISAKDVDDLSKQNDKKSINDLNSCVYHSCYDVASSAQSKDTCTSLYSAADPLRSISPDGVHQGQLGDCYYEAVVAGLAKNNPALIRDMIKDNHNGTYTVTFPGAKGEPITVKAPTEAELGYYNRGNSTGTWASVLEKAYGEYRRHHGHDALTPQEGAGGGGREEPVLELFTGSKGDLTNLDDAKKADIAKKLEAAFSSHPPKAVSANISEDNSDFWWWESKDPMSADKYYRDHAYTIIGFVPDGHGGGTVEVRNPWGKGDDSVDGTFRIPLDKFLKNFNELVVQH